LGNPVPVPEEIVPGTTPPLLIAHSGGNSADLTAAALESGADFLEVDLWVHRDRLEARHERRLPLGIPLLFERWYLARLGKDRAPLGRLLEATRGRAGLFLDLKNGGEHPSRIVAAALHGLEARVPVLASSQAWPILRAFSRAVPSIPLFYSVDVPAQLDLLLSAVARDPVPSGTSCRHALLTADVVSRLHEEGLDVVAWTVDDEERALELAAMGVDAITTHRVAQLRAALGA
jgi:glycerophosphoryl diester phosphodiesterase